MKPGDFDMILWAIKSPDGHIYAATVRKSEDAAIDGFTSVWPDYCNQGYRSVKVELKEVL